jgi:hypothetical protein
MDRLEIAKQIARENYGDGVGVIMLEGTPTKINGNIFDGSIPIKTEKLNRWEFKCFLKNNTTEVEKEFYLNLYELNKAEKLKRSRQAGNIDMDKKPVYEFVDKE